MGAGPRDSEYNNRYSREADEELAAKPPKIVWEKIRGGIWIWRHAEDSPANGPGRRTRPECKCNLFGSPKRRPGPQHDDECGRRHAW
jgi:hypothetical protein